MSATRGAIILAGGASERMGTPKALLPWANTTLLGYALREARLADVTQTIVVLGPATLDLAPTLDVGTVINPEPRTGRSTSIRLAAAALRDDLAAILIQSVDQPTPADVLEALFTALDGQAAVSLPSHAGRRGHPVCFAGRVLPELRVVDEQEEGLRAVVRRHSHEVVEVPVTHASVLWNLNDPAAYSAARAGT